MLGGRRVSTFTLNNKLYEVITRLEADERATPDDMRGIQVRGRDGGLVQIDQLATIEEGIGPVALAHYNRMRSFTLSASVAPGFSLGAALDSLYEAAAILPRGTDLALTGESRELEESGNALYFAFALALVVVFMVLAAQFESLVHPFTVLLAVPLAVTGALVTLLLAGSTLNLYSQIGMILLIGLVTKNSIAGGVCEPAPRAGPRHPDRDDRSGPDPSASDPDDRGGDDRGGYADRARPRVGVGQPEAARVRDRGGAHFLDAPDLVPRARRVGASRGGARAAPGEASRSKTGAGGDGSRARRCRRRTGFPGQRAASVG